MMGMKNVLDVPSSGSLIQCWKVMAVMCFSALVICASSGYNYYYYYGWEQTGSRPFTGILLTDQIFQTEPIMGMETRNVAQVRPIRSNSSHVNGKLMEPVNAKWDRNVFFAIKTTTKFLNSRIRHLMLTWFQAVDKDMVSFACMQ